MISRLWENWYNSIWALFEVEVVYERYETWNVLDNVINAKFNRNLLCFGYETYWQTKRNSSHYAWLLQTLCREHITMSLLVFFEAAYQKQVYSWVHSHALPGCNITWPTLKVRDLKATTVNYSKTRSGRKKHLCRNVGM